MQQIEINIPDDDYCRTIGGEKFLSFVLGKTLLVPDIENNPYYGKLYNRIDVIIDGWLDLAIVNHFEELISKVINGKYNKHPLKEGERYLVLYENRHSASAWYEARYELNQFIRPNGDLFKNEEDSSGIIRGVTKAIPLKYFLGMM
jgi:hypothetical protein